MFCPKCSLQQTSDDLRFCPRCGTRLDTIRGLVGQEMYTTDEPQPRGGIGLMRQKDISLGAALMFAGSIAANFWGFIEPHTPLDLILTQTYFILGGALVFILTLFHPLLGALQKLFSGVERKPGTSKRRDGINLGALLMFLGSLKMMLIAAFMHPDIGRRAWTALMLNTGVLLLLFVLRPLLRGVHSIFFKDEEEAAPRDAHDPSMRINSPARAAALPHAQSIPASDFATSRAGTAEIATPPSVTEDTTRKLDSY